jgi:DNA-binding FrmR family transcriptional regulator
MTVDKIPYRGMVSSMKPDTADSCGRRLRRIEGQVRGIARMIENDRYCIDILTQVQAVRAALRRVEDVILQDHVEHCVEGAIASGDQSEQRTKITELVEVLGRRSG